MDKLPQRDDLIYKEIEEFQDYELTNCIAYEMTVRNQEVKIIINEIDNLLVKLGKEYLTIREDTSNKLNIDFDEIYKGWEEYQDTKFEDEEDRKEPNYQNFFLNKNDSYLEIVKFLNILLKTYWIRYIYEDDILSYELKSDKNDTRSFYEIKKRLIELELIQELDEIKIDKNGEIIKNVSTLSQFNKDKVINLNRIYPNEDIKRLIIPKEYNKNISLKLNLNLPKEELIAYISKIKDEYDKDNSIIKTPLELLGKTLENENIYIKNLPKRDIKKIYADMFYIYDYFIFQDKKYKNEREKLKNKLKTKIKEINKTWDYDKLDKKEKIEQFSDNYKIEKQKYSKEQIIYELMEKLTFNKTKVNDYLKIMRIFIDDLEYKKLLTGGLKLY